MRFASAPTLDVIAPGLLQQEWRESEIFGAATWLWMQASTRRETPIKWLSTLLLPPIVHRQFLLATEGDRPVFYASWANFSVAAEQTYINGPHAAITMPTGLVATVSGLSTGSHHSVIPHLFGVYYKENCSQRIACAICITAV